MLKIPLVPLLWSFLSFCCVHSVCSFTSCTSSLDPSRSVAHKDYIFDYYYFFISIQLPSVLFPNGIRQVLSEDLRLESIVLPSTPCNQDKWCWVRERIMGQMLGLEEVKRVRKVAQLRTTMWNWELLGWISWSPVERCLVLPCSVLVFTLPLKLKLFY